MSDFNPGVKLCNIYGCESTIVGNFSLQFSHRHVCSVFGLSTKGKAGPIRDRIIKFVGDDEEKDTKVRELVTDFIRENSDDLATQSQEISSQNSYRTTSVSESDEEVGNFADDGGGRHTTKGRKRL